MIVVAVRSRRVGFASYAVAVGRFRWPLPLGWCGDLVEEIGCGEVVGQELRRFLETVNVSGELQKLLTSLSFEIRTEIRFIPNDEAVGMLPRSVA